MPRPTFADPKTDFAFKRIFGSEEHRDVLIAFLNDVLELDEPHRITRVDLLSPEQRPAVAELKLSIVDVRCTDARGVTYVVEMQVLQVEGFEKRVVYNVAKAYVNQIRQGEAFPELNDVVGITICDFELWPDEGDRKLPMLSRWRMTDYFFREAKNLTVVPEALSARPFRDALEAARVASFTVEEWDAYILARIAIQSEQAALAHAERRGRELGHELGERRGKAHGLRHGVEALCRVLGIELTDERQRELASLPATGLEALLARLQERRSWT